MPLFLVTAAPWFASFLKNLILLCFSAKLFIIEIVPSVEASSIIKSSQFVYVWCRTLFMVAFTKHCELYVGVIMETFYLINMPSFLLLQCLLMFVL